LTKFIPRIEGVQPGHDSYSQVVEAGRLVFLAGQVGSVGGRPETYPVDFAAEVRAAFASAADLLSAVGLGLESVVRCVIYLTDFADFPEMDRIFRELFPTDPPVRATVGVAALARDCRFEVEITASRPGEPGPDSGQRRATRSTGEA
jgi:2-iminobutanoate/2-iminopropanoate deaminase